MQEFVATLDIPEQARQSLIEMTPASYIGNATEASPRSEAAGRLYATHWQQSPCFVPKACELGELTPSVTQL